MPGSNYTSYFNIQYFSLTEALYIKKAKSRVKSSLTIQRLGGIICLELAAKVLVWLEVRRDNNAVGELAPGEILLCFLAVNDWVELHKDL